MDKTLNRLRAKVEPNKDNPQFLRTVYGEGVCFHPPINHSSHNISLGVDRFFGRQSQLDEMDRWLAGPGRLLTLTGVGGVGKTRLAQEACRRWLDSGERSSVWVCNFSEACSDEDFAPTVVRSLELQFGPWTTVASLIPVLKARGTWVLVLDDVDRLLDSAVEALTLWLTEVPNLKVVATSRERLGCRGEEVLELDGLDQADAGTACATGPDGTRSNPMSCRPWSSALKACRWRLSWSAPMRPPCPSPCSSSRSAGPSQPRSTAGDATGTAR